MIASENYKKQQERNLLTCFSQGYPYFPKGKIVAAESPDFIIAVSRKYRVGIELTRIIRPGSEDSESTVYQVPPLSKEFLVEKIESKEGKLSLYRKKKLNELWLIIVADTFERSASFNIRNQIEAWNIESRFDKVFLFEVRGNAVYVIK